MGMGGFAENVEKKMDKSKAVSALRLAFDSYAFPVVTAAFVVLCYYSAWDLAAIWCLAACIAVIAMVCKDLSPIVTPFLFINIIVSKKLSPATFGNSEPSDFYLRTSTITQLGVAIAIAVVALIVRACHCAYKGDFKPTVSFYCVCTFALALVLNGLFSTEYQAMGTLFGLLLALTFVALFVLIRGTVKVDETMLKKLAFNFAVFAAVLIVELLVTYLTCDIVVDGRVERGKLVFGWGVYNNMGMWLTCALPSAFYLAIKSRRFGFLFTAYAVVIFGAAFFTMSRQAMLGSSVIAVLGCLWLFVAKGGWERIVNIAIIVVSAAVITIAWKVWHDVFTVFFGSFWDSLQTGSGRTEIWKAAIKVYLENPVFGAGFYTEVHPAAVLFDGIDFLPPMNHNTIMELASACGTVGLVAYGAHRVQTVVSLVRDFRTPRIYIALTICAFLLVSLFDNYVFYILTTVTYVMLIALFDKSDKRA